MTMWYIGNFSPFLSRQHNFNEVFNEICVVLCNYTVMIFMMYDDVSLLDAMTIVFIVIVALNISFFVVQVVPAILFEPYNKCK
jgi:hypothetical protein